MVPQNPTKLKMVGQVSLVFAVHVAIEGADVLQNAIHVGRWVGFAPGGYIYIYINTEKRYS